MWLQRLLGISRKAKLMSQCFESHGRTVADNRVPWALPNWGVYCTYFELWPNPVVKIWQFQPMLSELRELLATLCVRRKQVSARAWTPSSGDGTKVAGFTSIPRKTNAPEVRLQWPTRYLVSPRAGASTYEMRHLIGHCVDFRCISFLWGSDEFCRLFTAASHDNIASEQNRASTEQLPSNHRATTEQVPSWCNYRANLWHALWAHPSRLFKCRNYV